MKRQELTALALVLALLLSLTACNGSEATTAGSTTATQKQEQTKADNKGSPTSTNKDKADKDKAQTEPSTTEKLIINDQADSLNKAEREKGYEIFYPLGVKFLLDHVYDEHSAYVKRRHLGMNAKADDPLFFSRAYYFRPDAQSKAYEKARALPEGQERDEKLAAIKKADSPLFGFFVFRADKAPKDEKQLQRDYGFASWEKLAAPKGFVQYFARGKDISADLKGEDQKVFEELYKAIDRCRASVSTFTPAKPETSFPGLSMDQFKAKDLQGQSIDSSYFKSARMTVLMYWISWCPDCFHQMQQFAAFKTAAEAAGIRFLSVCADLDEQNPDQKVLAAAEEKIKKAGLDPKTFITCYDSTALEDQYFIRAMNYPTILYVDQSGKVLKAFVAEDNLTASRFDRDLDELIAQGKIQLIQSTQPPAPVVTAAPTEPTESESEIETQTEYSRVRITESTGPRRSVNIAPTKHKRHG